MAKVSMSVDLDASADAVWATVGDFAALERWHPAVSRSETDGTGVGAVRDLHLAGGGLLRERLENLDAAGRSLRYTILEGPLPVQDYVSTLRVSGGDGRSTVHWSSEFAPAGASEAEAVEVIEGIYAAGFDKLKTIFGT